MDGGDGPWGRKRQRQGDNVEDTGETQPSARRRSSGQTNWRQAQEASVEVDPSERHNSALLQAQAAAQGLSPGNQQQGSIVFPLGSSVQGPPSIQQPRIHAGPGLNPFFLPSQLPYIQQQQQQQQQQQTALMRGNANNDALRSFLLSQTMASSAYNQSNLNSLLPSSSAASGTSPYEIDSQTASVLARTRLNAASLTSRTDPPGQSGYLRPGNTGWSSQFSASTMRPPQYAASLSLSQQPPHLPPASAWSEQQRLVASPRTAAINTAASHPLPASSSLNDRNDIGRNKLLYLPSDEGSVNPFQKFARQQIEFFEAEEIDVETNAQGRNKPVVLGQVGIRCIHCADLPPKVRTRAAVYYPSRLSVLYQAAQNIVNVHLPELCESIPDGVRQTLIGLDSKRSRVGGGKNYWSDAAKTQGVMDTEQGLRYEDRPLP